MMKVELKSNLTQAMQKFLDDNADELGSIHGIWQDDTSLGLNAELMANAAEVVIDAQELQGILHYKFTGGE